MSYVLAAIGILAIIALVVLTLKWRRSRQHIGIARGPDVTGVNDNPDAAVTPASPGYKQVIAPGADPSHIDQPAQPVEDALATHPGPLEPGQTFTPTSKGQNPENPAAPNPPQDPVSPA